LDLVQRVLESAHEIIDAGVPEKEGEDEEESMTVKLGRRRYKRALQVAELLAE
jgi:riboflavin synthase